MTVSPFATEVYQTSQKSTRGGRLIDRVVVHHAASFNLNGVVDMMVSGSRTVSSHLVIDGERIAAVVEEESRAWSLGSETWDGHGLVIETINSSGEPYWNISAESYVSLAKVIRDWCNRYDIPKDREHILGHREVYQRTGGDESYSTACPGGIDLDLLVRMVNSTEPNTKGDQLSLRLRTNAGPFAGLGFFLLETGKISVSRGSNDDVAWQDIHGGDEDGPYDVTTHLNFLAECNAFNIPYQAILDAVKYNGKVFPEDKPSAVVELDDAALEKLAKLMKIPTSDEVAQKVLAELNKRLAS